MSTTALRHSRFSFRGGWLYLVLRRSVLRMSPWPGLDVERRDAEGRWVPGDARDRDAFASASFRYASSSFDYLLYLDRTWWEGLPRQAIFAYALTSHTRRLVWSMRAASLFFAAVPPEAKARTADIPCSPDAAYKLASCAPALLDLARHDATLLAALAMHWQFPALGRERWDELRALAGHRRRDLLAWLGFPGSDGAADQLRKFRLRISHRRTAGYRVYELLMVLHAPALGEAIRRYRTTDSCLTQLLNDPRTLRHLNHAQLAEVLEDQTEGNVPRVGLVQYFFDLARCDFIAPAGEDEDPGTRDRARQAAELLATVPDRRLPAIPIPADPDIEPLRTLHDYLKEGLAMNHCVGSYAYLSAAGAGDIAVYRILAPVRATLALMPGENGWEVADLRGPSNARLPPSVRAAILARFESILSPPLPGFEAE